MTQTGEASMARIIKSGEEEEEDRLSAFPDFLIHRILSLFPATDLLKTSVLSKCWKYQWTHVPVLKFVHNAVNDGAIKNVLSGSPLLEYLELRNCRCDMFSDLTIEYRYNVIEIQCPTLERLRVSGRVPFRSLKLMNLPSSVYATLDFYFVEQKSDDELEQFDLEQLDDEMRFVDIYRIVLVQETLRQVEHVEKLEVGRCLMEISHGKINQRKR